MVFSVCTISSLAVSPFPSLTARSEHVRSDLQVSLGIDSSAKDPSKRVN